MLKMIFLTVDVDRSRTPWGAIMATGRIHSCVTEGRVQNMPGGGDGVEEGVEVAFFEPTNEELNFSCDSDRACKGGAMPQGVAEIIMGRGLEPCDPYTLAAILEKNPSFADEYSVTTVWRCEEDPWSSSGWCDAIFGRWESPGRDGVWKPARRVSIEPAGCGATGPWLFPGIRK